MQSHLHLRMRAKYVHARVLLLWPVELRREQEAVDECSAGPHASSDIREGRTASAGFVW